MSIEVYVAVDGRDTHRGTQKRPFATLIRARDALRALPAAERAGSTVWLDGGDYPLTETLRLSTRDDGHGTSLGLLEEGFFYEGDRPRRWANTDDAWIHGYWAYDWANSYERIAAIDVEARHIKTRPPHGNYGFMPGNRIYFLNILEELDTPGEYLVDRAAGILYLWPPRPPKDAEVMLSLLERPMVALRGARHVVLRDLELTATRGHAITVRDGQGCLVAGCRISNTGNYGVRIDGGTDHGVQSCDIWNNGDGGVSLAGGDRKTLTPCRHFVHNCHFHHQARWSRCYYPAVNLEGIGTRVSNNKIHDHPHCAILFWGNGHLIEYNDIHHVCHETGDVGAIYTGRNWTYRDNIIRFNHMHDIHGPGNGEALVVYLDDCVSGITVYGNLIVNTQAAVGIGGGRDCLVENNVFVDTHPAIGLDARGLDPTPVWRNGIDGQTPRYPLNLAEFDPNTTRIVKNSVRLIQDRPDDAHELVRYTNFGNYEDRSTGHLVITLPEQYRRMGWDDMKQPEDFAADCVKYTVEIE